MSNELLAALLHDPNPFNHMMAIRYLASLNVKVKK